MLGMLLVVEICYARQNRGIVSKNLNFETKDFSVFNNF